MADSDNYHRVREPRSCETSQTVKTAKWQISVVGLPWNDMDSASDTLLRNSAVTNSWGG